MEMGGETEGRKKGKEGKEREDRKGERKEKEGWAPSMMFILPPLSKCVFTVLPTRSRAPTVAETATSETCNELLHDVSD